jgi:Rieske Fe-S protein
VKRIQKTSFVIRISKEKFLISMTIRRNTMTFRKTMLSSVIGVSALTASVAYAAPPATTTDATPDQPVQQIKVMKGLTDAERAKLQPIVKSLQEKTFPLKQQQKALKTQLKGKIATKGTKMSDVQPLIDQINGIQKQMMTLQVEAQLQAFQEVGVMLPDKPKMKHQKTKRG